MKKDLLTFLVSREAPPQELNKLVKTDIQLSFRKREILLKFFSYQLLGAIFSLTFCPQFGLGFVSGHGIAHYFVQFGDWACATFCGSLFFSTGALVAFVGMKGEELWWVWERYRSPFFILPAVLWGAFMLLGTGQESVVFHVSWIAAAMGSFALLFWLRSRIYASVVSRGI